MPAQFDELQMVLLDGHKHDALNLLVMSVGGNDAGFGDYLIKYIVDGNNAATDDDLPDVIEEDIEALADAYTALNDDIGDRFPLAQVAIATYPDPTKGRYGTCGRAPGPIEYHQAYFCCELEVNGLTNPPEEYEFTLRRFIQPLNGAIRDAADAHGWRIISVDKRMGRHGICDCSDPYINTYGASVAVQGDVYGFMHPNKKGYREVFETPVANIVSAAFDDLAERGVQATVTATLLDEEGATAPAICTPPAQGQEQGSS